VGKLFGPVSKPVGQATDGAVGIPKLEFDVANPWRFRGVDRLWSYQT
jgi:hypothetical protein